MNNSLNCYGYPENPPTMPPVDAVTNQKLFLENQKYLHNMSEKSFEHWSREELLLLKHQLDLKKEKTREENRENRELAQLCGFENSDGKFCVEQRFPDGRSKYSIPILDVSQIRLVKEITPIGVYYRVKWKENPAGFVIKAEDLSTKKLIKSLESQGLVLKISKSKKAETADQLLQFLHQNEIEKQVACLFGWNKIGNDWIFNEEEVKYE